MKETIEQVVSRIEKDLVAMKTSQPTGSGSVRAYETLTNFVWDYDYTMSASNYNGITYAHGMSVKFTSRTQSAPFASIRIIAQINNQKYNPLAAQNFNGGPSSSPANSYITIFEDVFTSGTLLDYAQDNTVKWSINTSANTIGTNFKIKIIVTATDMGRIEVVPNRTFF